MLPLNVSFGIYAFLPMGWLFMAFIILGESFLMSRYLVRKQFDKKIYLSATVSNIVSGALGIITTMALTTISRNLMISRIMFMFGLRTGAHKVTVTSY